MLNNYELIKTIGKGGFSKVKLARNIEDQTEVAIKIHRLDDNHITQEHVDLFQNEVKLLSKIQHERITNIIDYYPRATVKQSDGSSYDVICVAVNEIAKGGELFYYIKNSGAFKEREARHLFIQILEGLEFLHSQGFCHRNLKPETILFTQNYDVKITNFLFSAPNSGISGDGYLNTFVGTQPYQAPEINYKLNYKGDDADVFSFGIILFIMVTGMPPFKVAEESDFFYRQIIDGKMTEYWQYFQSIVLQNGGQPLSEEFMNLIQKILAFKPEDRIKLDQIRQHSWVISQDLPSANEIKAELSRRHAVNQQRRDILQP